MFSLKRKPPLNWKKENCQFLGRNFETNNWLVSGFVVEKLLPIVSYHPYPLSELMLMAAVVLYFKPGNIFDWGTHLGLSARIFREIVREFKIDSRIFTIDLAQQEAHNEHPGQRRGEFVRNIKEVSMLTGDGATTALKVLSEVGSKQARALFFLDGDHSRESVSRELALLSKEVGEPIFLVHDTFFQTKESGYNVGPHDAVEDFLEKTPRYKKVAVELGLPGMTLLYPGKHK